MMFIAAVLVAAAALLVVVLDAPARSAGALIAAFVAAAAVISALDVPFLAGAVLLVGTGAVGLIVLVTVLLLNLTADERGARRLRLTPTIALFFVAYIGSALFGAVLPRGDDLVAAAPLGHVEVARAVFEDAAIPLSIALVALAVAVVAAFVLVRRRP